MLSHGEALYDETSAILQGEREGGAYVNKATVALALLWQDDPEKRAAVEELARILAVDVPTSTDHVGEVFVTDDFDGNGAWEFDNRVAVPHLWAATLTWLSWVAVTEPERFEPFRATGAELAVCDATDTPRRCGCAGAPIGVGVLPALLGWMAMRRSRD